jgi:ornithine cyclodeaminase/alanine dehydrogenase-like protein (mu-crystallin family)
VIELMPTADGDLYGFKYVNGHPGNMREGKQTVTAFGLLADMHTGYPVLLSEMTLLTALRTASMSALAARHLAPEGSRVMALIGNGAQSEFQALAFQEIVGVEEVRLWDLDPAATAKCARNLAGTGLRVVPCAAAEEAILGAQIVTTATADKRLATILTDNMVGSGVHINAVGGDSPGKTELAPGILHRSDIFVEYPPQTRIEGEIQQLAPDHPVTELWQVITGAAPGTARWARGHALRLGGLRHRGLLGPDLRAGEGARDRALRQPRHGGRPRRPPRPLRDADARGPLTPWTLPDAPAMVAAHREDAMERIGFVGAGLMGHGMAHNLVTKGFPLTVIAHRRRDAVDDLVGKGATEASSLSDLAAASDVVVLCLTAAPQVEAVVREMMGALAPRSMVVDCSTSDPVLTERLGAELHPLKVSLVDAPLGRTPKDAWEGTLDCMVGAVDMDWPRAETVLRAFAERVTRIGGPGAGHRMKLINNLLSLSYGALYSEALALSRKVGIDVATFDSVIRGGRMDCAFYRTFMGYALEGDRDAHRFTLTNAYKDLRYAESMANAAGVATPVLSAAKNHLAGAVAQGGDGPEDYLPHLADFVARANGVEP